jgi:PTH2 family peptidyl-tRNA hydrolase
MKGEPKQVIVIRKDLKMSKGKIAAQAAHASLKACMSLGRIEGDKLVLNLSSPVVHQWFTQRFKKVCVCVESEQELLDIHELARQNGLPCSLIQDAGDTEFDGVPTLTAVAIGPAKEKHIDKITGNLKLL